MSTCTHATNSAESSRKQPAIEARVTTSHSAACTRLRVVTTSRAEPAATTPRSANSTSTVVIPEPPREIERSERLDREGSLLRLRGLLRRGRPPPRGGARRGRALVGPPFGRLGARGGLPGGRASRCG